MRDAAAYVRRCPADSANNPPADARDRRAERAVRRLGLANVARISEKKWPYLPEGACPDHDL